MERLRTILYQAGWSLATLALMGVAFLFGRAWQSVTDRKIALALGSGYQTLAEERGKLGEHTWHAFYQGKAVAAVEISRQIRNSAGPTNQPEPPDKVEPND